MKTSTDRETPGTVAASPPRRGRPTKDRAASLGRQIREMALELFVTQGFETVTMDAIAAQLSMSKGTLYSRYASKADLLRAIISEEIKEWGERASASAGPLPDDLRERLRLHAHTIISSEGWNEIRRLERLIAQISGSFPDLAAAYNEVGQRSYLRYLAADIEHSLKRRTWVGPSAGVLAMILLHTITGWYRAQSVARVVSEDEAMALADEVIAAIMASVLAKE